MPATEGPSVSVSFANNFWGKDDAGVGPLLDRMQSAKITSDELKSFYTARAALEDEYARKLLALSRKPLGSHEEGSLRASLDVVRGEVESMGKAHQSIAHQMKAELDEQLTAFAGGLKERRKIIQNGIEKLLKTKTQQTQQVNKSRDRFEQDCLRIKGYLAQGHMVMGQEERKNKAKLEKTQIQMASTSNEYEAAIKALEETTGRWNRDWKAACDKFQDLEEERIDFTKSSLWTFANIASTVCVSDDSSCEKIRLSLENCEVEKDIIGFIQTHGTGQEIPDAPKYINFCRGDINDSASEVSEDDSYSVAQFQRNTNPAYRTSSPAPPIAELQHDPSADLKRLNLQDDQSTPKATQQPTASNGPVPGQPDFRRQAAEVQQAFNSAGLIDLAPVPHNEYPTDGMTMFCRSDMQSDLSSANSPVRPGSRDTTSEYSNPTSFSSIEPSSRNISPVKELANGSAASSPTKTVLKKRSGFFSNSPFRRRSKHEKDRGEIQSSTTAVNTMNNRGNNQSLTKPGIAARDFAVQPDDLEPVDPRANFQLNVGNNVFDVASPDHRSKPTNLNGRHPIGGAEDDPLVAALAELKGVSKQPAARVSADRYAGVATPAPGNRANTNVNAPNQRGDAPPGYHDPGVVTRLDAPKPAQTAASMRATTRQYTNQNADIYGLGSQPGTVNANRAPSPNPMRGASPRPGMDQNSYRSASPNPYGGQSPQQMRQVQGGQNYQRGYGGNSRQPSPADARIPSPQPGFRQNQRPGSAQAMVLSGDGGSRNGRGQVGRPMSQYAGSNQGPPMNDNRARSKSAAAVRPLYFARAIYSYTAAIPEELSFQKHDTLAILRLQDDGWWEAEVQGGRGGVGLVPSNYLQRC